MGQFIQFLFAVAKIVPLQAIGDLFKAALPLPDWSDAPAVRAWFARVGIVDPLAAVLVPLIDALIADAGPIKVGAIDDAELTALVQAEADKAGFIDPATLALIIALIKEFGPVALEWFRRWRERRQAA